MVNPDSTLYAEHPDWVVGQPTRPRREFRQQYVLDTLQPAVADFVLDVVDRTLAENPGISYLKWDANRPLTDPGSPALARDRQANYWVDHVRATWDLMAAVAERHPEQTLMLCASGGGRVDLGSLRWFHEVWLSDNTDPVDRVRMQWAASHFLPANVVAAHVTQAEDRPIAFGCAVAMSARFGFDVDFAGLTDEELAVCRRAVALYREVRPLVQQGDLWRLVPPDERAALSYVSPDADAAVVFGFQLADGTAGTGQARYAWVDSRRSRTYEVTAVDLAAVGPDGSARAAERRGADGTWPRVAAQRGVHGPNLGAPGHLTLREHQGPTAPGTRVRWRARRWEIPAGSLHCVRSQSRWQRLSLACGSIRNDNRIAIPETARTCRYGVTVSTGSKPSERDPWRWYLPHRAIVLLGVVLILIALGGATLGVVNAARAEALTSRLTDRYLVLLPPVRQIRASESAFQVLAEQAFANATAAPSVVTGAVSDSNAINKAYLTLQHLLALPGNANLAPASGHPDGRLRRGAVEPRGVPGRRAADGTTTHLADVEKSAASNLDATLASLQTTIDDRLDTTADQAGDRGQQCTGRPPVVHRRRARLRGHRDRDPRPARTAGRARAVPARGRAVRSRASDRVRGEPADRTGDVESRGVRLRYRGGGAQPGRSGHAVRAAPGRFQHGPLPAGARQHRAGRRRRVRRHVPRRLPGRIEGADHGVPLEHRARCLSQPPGPRVLRVVRPDEHQWQLHGGLPCDHGGRHATFRCDRGERGGGRTAGHRSGWRCCAPSRSPRPRPTATPSRGS